MATVSGKLGGSMGGNTVRGVQLHTEISRNAAAILGGRGRGDVIDGNAKRGVRDVNNNPNEGTVGKSMGSNYTAGNINTGGKGR